VLDRFHAGESCAAHAFGGSCMGAHRNVGAPGGFDDELEFVEREGWRGARSAPAIVGVDLDPIGAATDLIAHDTRQTINTVSFFCALRHGPFRRVTFWSITTGGHDRARRDEHSWTRNDALFNCLLETDVGVARAFRSEIANGSETGLQRVAKMVCCSSDAQA
jgi:hypothetical protein